jgi:hypothetical protein
MRSWKWNDREERGRETKNYFWKIIENGKLNCGDSENGTTDGSLRAVDAIGRNLDHS